MVNGSLEQMLMEGERQQHGAGSHQNTEPFTNLFPQMNLSRNCMILIVVLLILILFKDEIMKSSVVKSISKSLK